MKAPSPPKSTPCSDFLDRDRSVRNERITHVKCKRSVVFSGLRTWPGPSRGLGFERAPVELQTLRLKPRHAKSLRPLRLLRGRRGTRALRLERAAVHVVKFLGPQFARASGGRERRRGRLSRRTFKSMKYQDYIGINVMCPSGDRLLHYPGKRQCVCCNRHHEFSSWRRHPTDYG